VFQLRSSIDLSADFSKCFEEIVKNPGVCFLSLDPSETRLQLFHHPTVIGGSWKDPNKRLIAFIDFEFESNPIEIVQKSIREVKGKSHSIHEFELGCYDIEDFKKLRNPKSAFHYKNIVPIPSFLTKTFLELPSTEPTQVAMAFFDILFKCDLEAQHHADSRTQPSGTEDNHDSEEGTANLNQGNTNDDSIQTENSSGDSHTSNLLEKCLHIIQFCHLCAIGKMNPVLFTSIDSTEAHAWKSSTLTSAAIKDMAFHKFSSSKHKKPEIECDDDNELSPAMKLSKRDDAFISTMLKIHESVDKTLARNNLEKEEKEPGFKKLEPHKKQFILNASAIPPFDSPASDPTEFYSQFLAKKSQFKAKEMLLHRFSVDEIAFNPNTNFVACLWNCEFLWILPDSPSGISIFFCPESKSMNASELEKERLLSLADKVKQADIDKLSKQKITIPSNLMDLFWMTQNLHAVVSLCFGKKSVSATYLNGWAKHMYKHRIQYSSMQGSDTAFYTKVLFAIDNALQIHWKSCCDAVDRQSVNDTCLLSSDIQDSIIRRNFSQSIPRQLMEKVDELESKVTNKNLDKNDNIEKGNGKYKNKQMEEGKPIYNSNKNHKRWRLQDGREYSKIFFPFQKQCPKTKEGKQMCMKFLIRGFCEASCPRAHQLSTDDETTFDKFYHKCREEKEGATKPDF